jgi:hypothetical protein
VAIDVVVVVLVHFRGAPALLLYPKGRGYNEIPESVTIVVLEGLYL